MEFKTLRQKIGTQEELAKLLRVSQGTDVEEYAIPYANVSYTADGESGYYLTQISGVPSGTKAWALVVTATGDILFGENVTATGNTITYPTSGDGAFYVPLNVKEI